MLKLIEASRLQETRNFPLKTQNMAFKWTSLIKPYYFDDEGNNHRRYTQQGVVLAVLKVQFPRKCSFPPSQVRGRAHTRKQAGHPPCIIFITGKLGLKIGFFRADHGDIDKQEEGNQHNHNPYASGR